MTTTFANIESALDYRLSTLSGAPPIAWRNTGYVPVIGTLYLAPFMLPAPTRAGDFDSDYYSGIYQVSIFAPAGAGRSASLLLADVIADHFLTTTQLVSGPDIINILGVSQNIAIDEEAWYHVPVDVSYWCFSANR